MSEISSMMNTFAPDALTLDLARANHLDLDALAANHAGRLSFNQIRTILESVGVALLFWIGLVGLGLTAVVAFGAISSQDWLGMITPCGLGIVLVFAIGGLYNLQRRVGGNKYTQRFRTLALVIPDLVMGQVASAEGMTTRQIESDGKDPTDSSDAGESYWYCAGDVKTCVDKEGYLAFPKDGLECYLYFLPRSKALVNLRVANQR